MYGFVHHALVLVVPLGVAYLMILSGVGHSALEWKHRSRTCPSCGRPVLRCSCGD